MSTSLSALPSLDARDRRALLWVARDALEASLEGRPVGVDPVGSPALFDRWPTFVTWRIRASGALRGCRGEIGPRRPLIESVREMAVAAATGDPRFERVQRGEVGDLTVSISVVGPMVPISPTDVEVGRHGLWVVSGNRSGLLLPSVPVDCGWDREQFLAGVCLKAGLSERRWRSALDGLQAFETLSWGDAAGPAAD